MVRFNGRFVDHEDCCYEEKLVHVAYGVVPRRDLFELAEPDQALTCMVDLW